MAERRMFAKTIVLSDAFLDMPMSARCLYFTLGMLADDDGFVNNPKSIMRQCGASEDDIRVLLSKRYVLAFDSGVIVIKHWRINNYLQNDRITPTKYIEEKAQLEVTETRSYRKKDADVYAIDVYTDKNSIDKNSIDKSNNNTHFKPPTLEEVQSYCQERQNGIDAESFIDYYEARNWMLGKVKMKDWKAAVRTWERNGYSKKSKVTTSTDYKAPDSVSLDELRKRVSKIAK